MTKSFEPEADITVLLQQWNADHGRPDRLMELVMPDLKRIATYRMSNERLNHTLQPTGLISELYVYLASRKQVNWQNRAHFFAVCSEAMRRILVDHARSRTSKKRGGALQVRDLEGVDAIAPTDVVDVLILDELLNRMAEKDARMAQVVELRFFGGLTNEEVAEVLGCAERTVKRDWDYARTWLYRQLRQGTQDGVKQLGKSEGDLRDSDPAASD